MRRYAAFLRGVSPMNLKMPALKECLEGAGFDDVRTVLSSGNAVFGARAAKESTLERRCEEAMAAALDRSFLTIVRPVNHLRELLEADPFARFRLAKNAKRVVTFLRDPPETKLTLPHEVHGARILALRDREVLTAYVESPRAAYFMTLLEKTFGKAMTTRTWETVKKVAARSA